MSYSDLANCAREVMSKPDFLADHKVYMYMKDRNGDQKTEIYENVYNVIAQNDYTIALYDKNGSKIVEIYPDESTTLNTVPAINYGVDETNGGSTNSGCYLTTACVDYFGKPDDCYELETLRSFRDGFMQTSTEMKEAAKKYYVIAPKIVAKINSLPNKASVYQKMYTDLVQKCINLINKGKNKEAYETYKDYSEALEEKYL